MTTMGTGEIKGAKHDQKKWLSLFLALIMAVGAFIHRGSGAVYAEGEEKAVDVAITDFRLLNWRKQTAHRIDWTDRFYIQLDCDAVRNGTLNGQAQCNTVES